jgi:hypothetical protein
MENMMDSAVRLQVQLISHLANALEDTKRTKERVGELHQSFEVGLELQEHFISKVNVRSERCLSA